MYAINEERNAFNIIPDFQKLFLIFKNHYWLIHKCLIWCETTCSYETICSCEYILKTVWKKTHIDYQL